MRLLLTDAQIAAIAQSSIMVGIFPLRWTACVFQSGRAGNLFTVNIALGPLQLTIFVGLP